ncbi:MAG: hypothetical protein A2046_04250 [Bacteroidetes bacterium GWA2_30_7]|nr:MAG: hypothetical protein A2046_04250 [Bacteroidetes bacterium GWA2_30_7]
MQLKFIIDTQLPPLLYSVFKRFDCNAIHTTFYPDGHLLKDKQIREIAIIENLIIVTKDEDFIDYYLIKGAPPKILLLDIGNINNKDLVSILVKQMEEIKKSFIDNCELVIIQRNNLIAY